MVSVRLFLTAAALPLLVALTELGSEWGLMLPENTAPLVGVGVRAFPPVAVFREVNRVAV